MQQSENATHKASHGRRRAVVLLCIFAVWLIVAGIGCSPMAVATHEGLKLVGVESEIALANVNGSEIYGHVFVVVDGRPYEPRFAGVVLLDHIDYAHPYDQFSSTDEYLDTGYMLFPPMWLIADAAREWL